MNSRWLQDYTIQTVLATMQSTVIVSGIMATGAMLKARGYPDFDFPISPQVWFVRHWGLSLLIIPSAWVFVTVWLEARREGEFTKRWSIITGVVVLGILVVFLSHTAMMAIVHRVGAIQSVE